MLRINWKSSQFCGSATALTHLHINHIFCLFLTRIQSDNSIVCSLVSNAIHSKPPAQHETTATPLCCRNLLLKGENCVLFGCEFASCSGDARSRYVLCQVSPLSSCSAPSHVFLIVFNLFSFRLNPIAIWFVANRQTVLPLQQ